MGKRLTDEERAYRAVTEEELRGRCRDVALMYGWLSHHHRDSRRQVRKGVFVGDEEAAGFPDHVFLRAPEVVVVEFKIETKHPTEKQQEWLDGFAACGIEAYVIRPSNEHLLRERLRRPRRTPR